VNRRHLLLLGLAAVLLASAGGTGGFSAVDASRGIEVAVVDDDEAYLGIEQHGVNGDTWKLTLTNRLSAAEPLEVTVTVDTRTLVADDRTSTATATGTGSVTETVRVGGGSTETVTADGVACGDSAEITAETVDGSVVIEATREVACEASWGTPTATATPTSTPTPTTETQTTTATATATPTPTATSTATATPTPTATGSTSASARAVDPSP
jgi:hypothetical protein